MLVALSSLASVQAEGTEATMEAAIQLLNYAATHPDATICYFASGMQLHSHSDASYLSESKACSRVGGLFFLSSKDDPKNSKPPPINGAIQVISSILKNVMSSAAEAEVGGLFKNGKEAAMLRTILEEMGWPQSDPTPIQTDNSCAEGIINDTVKQKCSKAMDMHFYWIKDRVKQGHF